MSWVTLVLTLHKFQVYHFVIGRVYSLLCAPHLNSLLTAWKAEPFISSNGLQMNALPSHWKSPACPGRDMGELSLWTSVCWELCSEVQPSVCSVKGGRPLWVSFCKCSPRRMLTSQQRFRNFGAKLLAVGFTDVYFVSLKAKREYKCACEIKFRSCFSRCGAAGMSL